MSDAMTKDREQFYEALQRALDCRLWVYGQTPDHWADQRIWIDRAAERRIEKRARSDRRAAMREDALASHPFLQSVRI